MMLATLRTPRGPYSWIRRSLAAIGVALQLVLTLGALSDVQSSPQHSPTIAAVVAAADGITVGSDQGAHRAHDEATCVACLAQSMHARLGANESQLSFTLAEGSHTWIAARTAPPSRSATHTLSRAPPAVS